MYLPNSQYNELRGILDSGIFVERATLDKWLPPLRQEFADTFHLIEDVTTRIPVFGEREFPDPVMLALRDELSALRQSLYVGLRVSDGGLTPP
jgi:hypothetical protein